MMRPVPNRMPPTLPRIARACLPLALLLPGACDVASSLRGSAVYGTLAPATTPDVFCGSTSPVFRLGNAARPLGWSTAIGDFNVDGAPDIAVADRISHGASGYSYRIQFSISGQASDAVTFESATDAITLLVSDVDADNDLDVIASAVLSKDIVGVWLNDGHGRFTSSDVRQLPAAIHARQTLDSTDPSAEPSSFDVAPRWIDGHLPALARGPTPAVSLDRFVARDIVRARSTIQSSAAGPRAPPSVLSPVT